ncbi:MAG: ABC transporter, substrate-binding protein (cluster 3, basic aa/glutamine/opines) [uncultured Arthrobacter sp.]|uniref:ABC transporter, substrate-binding protein (Cluster 3, basic aa/glutamine/opines) n=1 Tax=uncultured Arthrobacter sp. TaxID=114050 RepID=A0A6J4H0K5_9MICC|nr:ABC transporter substrate-binding protein [uncultured Arthrobacter sp.]CAA9209620.1 MAG: ABC transporter, substrate-binding protein (cluster 3, basic aa/glutamine/opines) [uncultured Arthrobacter sp.]
MIRTFSSPLQRLAYAGSAVLALALTGCGGGQAESAEGQGSGSANLPLVKDGVLTSCANFSTPPNIFAEADGTPVGAEVDIAKSMAEEMGLETAFPEYAFAGLIPALQAKQCDVIMSTLYIKPEREEIADFVPYLLSGSGVSVSKENPAGVTGFDDTLCGVRAAAITGATGAGLLEEKSAECESAGMEPVEISLLDRSADALQQVVAGQADAFVDTYELMKYYEKQSDGDFQVVGDPVGQVQIGAATLKENAELHEALEDAFGTIVENGRYAEILKEWGFEAQDIANAE